ncbi:MAG TPA: AI-2E family transporter [Ktedonobacterales bacterium]|nr:AI-2E family transporter [Ktedonobacterales bacterium]
MSDDTARSPDGQPATQPARRHLTIAIEPHTLWLATAIVLGVLALGFVFAQALGVFIVIFIAIILAEGIRPLVDRMQEHRVPRPLAVLLIYLVIFVVLGALAYALVQPLVSQLAAFADALPGYATEAQQLLIRIQQLARGNAQIQQAISLLEGQIGSILSNTLPVLLHLPFAIGDLIFNALLILLITFLWLTNIGRLRPFVLGLLPSGARPTAQEMIDDSSRKLGGYLQGVLVNMIVIGTLSGLGLWLLGVPYPALLGVLAGLTELIPFLGPWISGAVAVVVAALAVDPLKAVEVIVLFMVLQQVEGNTLVPLVMHHAVEINPLLVVVAVLIGGALFGVAGSVLSVPLAALLEVVVVRALAPAVRRASARVDARHLAREDKDTGATPPEPPTPPSSRETRQPTEPTEPAQPTQPAPPHVPAPT